MVGESVTVDGKVFTVDYVYSDTVQINGEFVDLDESVKMSGVRVQVERIAYDDNNQDLSRVILRIGEEISETFSDGDAYIGEDDDDPLWVWDINLVDSAESYIGVIYNVNINDGNDDDGGDSIKYVGDSYVLPEGFGGVTLEGLTSVNYEDVAVSFEEADLYNNSDDASAVESENVMTIAVPAGSVEMSNGDETTELYLHWNSTSEEVELYYKDTEGEYTPTGKARFENSWELNVTNTTVTTVETLEIGDTDVAVKVFSNPAGSAFNVTFVTTDDDDIITLEVGGTGFEQLGSAQEDAEEGDVWVGTTALGTKDVPIMDHYGIIISDGTTPEDETDSDEITISFPDEQVFAEVSVTAGSSASQSDSGILKITDSEVAQASGMNLVVVGGSAINSVAADLLDGTYSEAAFTEATGVGNGQFLIQSFDRGSGNVALLVAGYAAEDTTKAATYLINNNVDTTVGKKYVGTSSTEAELVVN
jgi:hypothetical protein